ncbi:MAG TPA: serine/threonine-protein kinase, partial [Vicinamibacteria bacterium]
MSDRRVGHYRVLSPLGGGGMGVVYEAEDLRLGRRVALKFLSPDLARTPAALARLLREARAVSSLSHPHICGLFDVGEDGGQPFLVMERLEGKTLKAALASGPLPLDRILDLGAQMADALDAAHANGIVHLDVKPSNVFVTRRGDAKLMDFGLAQVSAEEPEVVDAHEATRTGRPGSSGRARVAAGTVSYMSPEQARGDELDRQSDLFSLGAVLHEMATGKPPFPGPSAAEIFEGILGKEPPPVDRDRPEAAILRPIVEKALSKERALRYQTAADLRVDLKRAQVAVKERPPAGARASAVSLRGPWIGF